MVQDQVFFFYYMRKVFLSGIDYFFFCIIDKIFFMEVMEVIVIKNVFMNCYILQEKRMLLGFCISWLDKYLGNNYNIMIINLIYLVLD